MNRDEALTWCQDCQRHKIACTCDIKKHIFRVRYHLVIETGPTGVWCQEAVRVIAYDLIHAREQVREWLQITPIIWFPRKGEILEHALPVGPRDITIVTTEKYLDDVGALLRSCPMPNIMPPEE